MSLRSSISYSPSVFSFVFILAHSIVTILALFAVFILAFSLNSLWNQFCEYLHHGYWHHYYHHYHPSRNVSAQSHNEGTTSTWYLYRYVWVDFTPCSGVSTVKFKQVNAHWDYNYPSDFSHCLCPNLFWRKFYSQQIFHGIVNGSVVGRIEGLVWTDCFFLWKKIERKLGLLQSSQE